MQFFFLLLLPFLNIFFLLSQSERGEGREVAEKGFMYRGIPGRGGILSCGWETVPSSLSQGQGASWETFPPTLPPPPPAQETLASFL